MRGRSWVSLTLWYHLPGWPNKPAGFYITLQKSSKLKLCNRCGTCKIGKYQTKSQWNGCRNHFNQDELLRFFSLFLSLFGVKRRQQWALGGTHRECTVMFNMCVIDLFSASHGKLMFSRNDQSIKIILLIWDLKLETFFLLRKINFQLPVSLIVTIRSAWSCYIVLMKLQRAGRHRRGTAHAISDIFQLVQ